jgi:hypothetical protein
MIRNLLFIFCLCLCINTNAQSNFKKFSKLSRPKKVWVIFHPFKAKKALRISEEAQRISDSITKTDLLDRDASGGQVDAFRHAFWMASLRKVLGKCAAQSLGKAHEKENYLTYKRRGLEDGVVPDKISSEMDLYNNEQGLKLITKGSLISSKALVYKVINAIESGRMKIIKKDKKGNFLTCAGTLISNDSIKGKWENNKCLINSN